MDANDIARSISRLDDRSAEARSTHASILTRIERIESRVNEIHDLVRYIRYHCAEEEDLHRVRDIVKGIESTVDHLS